RSHVARRRIDLTRSRPLEVSPFHARVANRLTLRAIPLHGATKQIAGQGKGSRGYPEPASYSLAHQSGERCVEAPLEGNPQQNHPRVRIQILLARLMLRVGLPGIEETDEVWPRISTSMPPLVLPGMVCKSSVWL